MTDLEVHDKLKDMHPISTRVTPGPGAINWVDVGKGALYAVLAAVLPLVQQALPGGVFNWKIIGGTALSTLVGYLVAKFFTPAQQITTFTK